MKINRIFSTICALLIGLSMTMPVEVFALEGINSDKANVGVIASDDQFDMSAGHSTNRQTVLNANSNAGNSGNNNANSNSGNSGNNNANPNAGNSGNNNANSNSGNSGNNNANPNAGNSGNSHANPSANPNSNANSSASKADITVKSGGHDIIITGKKWIMLEGRKSKFSVSAAQAGTASSGAASTGSSAASAVESSAGSAVESSASSTRSSAASSTGQTGGSSAASANASSSASAASSVSSATSVNKSPGSSIASVTYSSSNTRVATVSSSGKVKAHAKGRAKVTATITTTDGSTFTKSVTIKVLHSQLKRSARNRHPARFKRRIRKLERRHKATKTSTQNRIIFYGNSNIRRWRTLRKDMRGLNVFNHGFGGAFVDDCLFYADRMIIPYNPEAIVFYAGPNDIAAGFSRASVYKRTIEFFEYIHCRLPETQIYYIQLPMQPARARYWHSINALNRRIRKYCKSDPQVTFINASEELNKGSRFAKRKFYKRGRIHLNRRGYRIWTKAIRPVLIERYGK